MAYKYDVAPLNIFSETRVGKTSFLRFRDNFSVKHLVRKGLLVVISSMATRRNGASSPTGPSKASTQTINFSDTSSTLTRPIPPSPYYLLVYPTILLLGSAFAVISPTASGARYIDHAKAMAPGLASDLSTPTGPPPPINYFASKRNFLNVYFVKILWFWTTIAFGLILSTTHLPLLQQQSKSSNRRKPATGVVILQSITRYVLITSAWYLTTQWFFGPALIDRSFTLTGGSCDLPLHVETRLSSPEKVVATVSSVACKRSGGSWAGGHDISGHVFLLVISISFLLLELWLSDRVLQSYSRAEHPHISQEAAERIARETSAKEKQEIGGWESSALEATARKYTRWFVWTIVVLGFWMLLMTSIWFHSLGEKLSGLALASSVVYGVFWAGRFNRGWKSIVGGV